MGQEQIRAKRREEAADFSHTVPGIAVGTRRLINLLGDLCRLFEYVYLLGYTVNMHEIRQTEIYAEWFASLRDRQARARIDVRIRRLSLGNPGDVRPVGEGVSELRIDYGPGYRIYFVPRGQQVVILLAGGDKRTQAKDIETAIVLARDV